MKLPILLASLAVLAVALSRVLAVGRKPEKSTPQRYRDMLAAADREEQRLRDRFAGMVTR